MKGLKETERGKGASQSGSLVSGVGLGRGHRGHSLRESWVARKLGAHSTSGGSESRVQASGSSPADPKIWQSWVRPRARVEVYNKSLI